MAACASCGEENPDRAKFCLGCGSPVPTAGLEPRTARKTVTIVFSDLVGSTAMGERLDPESIQHMMARYFEEMRSAVERHGGTVGKFIGDAVMAVFGIPTLHEDDALRAVRAAAEMSQVMQWLNDEFERDWGVRLSVRTGVNTGEVLAGGLSAEEGLALGDPVNVAARLEQAAPAGKVLLGAETHRLVRDAVRVEAIEPLVLKGKAEPLPAYELVEVKAGAPALARRLDSPLVGREEELAALWSAYERSSSEPSCQLFTVVGSAGMGKSRLVGELLDRVSAEARVLSGRCLSYGEGITYWPIAEMVRQAAVLADGDPLPVAREKLRDALASEGDADLIAGLVAQMVGLSDPIASPEELFWGLRRFFEVLAGDRQLVVMFDDLQWAEPALLDLIETVAEGSTGAPLTLLCTGRHELFDARPTWGEDRTNAGKVTLGALSADESKSLLKNLLGCTELPPAVEDRIVEAAEGVPLFIEEMLGVLIDDGMLRQAGDAWVPTVDLTSIPMPPTIAALVAARLERLALEEHTVLDCGAVVGKVFWASAVSELAPEALRPQMHQYLLGLVRRELVRPDRSSFAGHEAFRFRHLLIRDAAYAALPKGERARLHQSFAAWLEATTSDRVSEYEGIVGFHLEQAVRLRAELGPPTEEDRAVGWEAARWLGAAGRRALAQDDFAAATGLFTRATALSPADDPERLELLLTLADSLTGTGDLALAEEVVAEELQRADSIGDERLRAHGAVARAILHRATYPERAFDEREVTRAIEVFQAHGDHRGEALSWIAIARHLWDEGRVEQGDELAHRALELSQQAGDTKTVTRLLGNLSLSGVLGPLPTSQGLRHCDQYAEAIEGRVGEARVNEARALLRAMRGDFDGARSLLTSARATYDELGMAVDAAIVAQPFGEVERLAGDPAAAEAELRSGYEALVTAGERNYLSTLAAQLAHVLHEQGRLQEADHFADVAAEGAGEDDVVSQAWATSAKAKVLAARGEAEEAERLSRESVDLLTKTDWSNDQASALMDLAEVLRLSDRNAEAIVAIEAALAHYEAKESLVSAERARRMLADLRP